MKLTDEQLKKLPRALFPFNQASVVINKKQLKEICDELIELRNETKKES